MLLSNVNIMTLIRTQDLRISPFCENLVRASSICLRLGREYLSLEANQVIDLKCEETYPTCNFSVASHDSGILVPSRGLVLANTLEKIALPYDVAGWISNLSGLARLGLQVVLSSHISPGYGQQGMATLTLELSNTLNVPILVYPEMRICHLVLMKLMSAPTTTYDLQVGTYSGQTTPRSSQFYLEFES